MKTSSLIALPLVLLGLGFGTAFVFAQTSGQMQGGMHSHQDEHMGRMLNGRDTTDAEVAELRALFVDHAKISRSVTNLPNGIRTLTETEDDNLRAALVSHVVGMIDRVEEKRDPAVPIQSPTLDLLFRHPELITTTIEPTEKGVAVIQTSEDPDMVVALQTHAGEVSDLAERGMEAAHDAMIKRQSGG